MFQRWSLLSIAVVVPIVSFNVPATACDDALFLIETKRESDRVEVRTDQDKSIIFVRSPFGISQATIQRKAEHWPADVEVRLYLKGLESLQISSAMTTLNAAASMQHGELKLRVWKDDVEENLLLQDNKYWTDIRIVESSGHSVPTIPLTSGCFAISLPKAMLVENPKSIVLKWIDFYRN